MMARRVEPPPAPMASFDVFNVWETAAEAIKGDLAFSARAEMPPAVTSVWRLDLPADLEQAKAHLAGAKNQLSASHKALDDIPRRLEHFRQSQQSESASKQG